MTPNQLIEALRNTTGIRDGGSPHGMSADIRATSCGMMEAFSRAVPRQPMLIPQSFTDRKGKPFVIGSRAGSVFHALQELWRTNPLLMASLPKADDFDGVDEAIGAALMAFDRYRKQNYDDAAYLGSVVGAEVPVEGQIAGQLRTGRIDQVIDADQNQVDRWADYGILAAEPGIYLWDYKLLKAVSVDDATEYQHSMQALAYLHLYEAQTGIKPQGFVYELVSRAKKPTISRLLVLVPNGHDNLAILESFVTLATKRRAEAAADPSKCDSQYGECPFISVCPRYGTAEQHKHIIENHALLKQVRLDKAA